MYVNGFQDIDSSKLLQQPGGQQIMAGLDINGHKFLGH